MHKSLQKHFISTFLHFCVCVWGEAQHDVEVREELAAIGVFPSITFQELDRGCQA